MGCIYSGANVHPKRENKLQSCSQSRLNIDIPNDFLKKYTVLTSKVVLGDNAGGVVETALLVKMTSREEEYGEMHNISLEILQQDGIEVLFFKYLDLYRSLHCQEIASIVDIFDESNPASEAASFSHPNAKKETKFVGYRVIYEYNDVSSLFDLKREMLWSKVTTQLILLKFLVSLDCIHGTGCVHGSLSLHNLKCTKWGWVLQGQLNGKQFESQWNTHVCTLFPPGYTAFDQCNDGYFSRPFSSNSGVENDDNNSYLEYNSAVVCLARNSFYASAFNRPTRGLCLEEWLQECGIVYLTSFYKCFRNDIKVEVTSSGIEHDWVRLRNIPLCVQFNTVIRAFPHYTMKILNVMPPECVSFLVKLAEVLALMSNGHRTFDTIKPSLFGCGCLPCEKDIENVMYPKTTLNLNQKKVMSGFRFRSDLFHSRLSVATATDSEDGSVDGGTQTQVQNQKGATKVFVPPISNASSSISDFVNTASDTSDALPAGVSLPSNRYSADAIGLNHRNGFDIFSTATNVTEMCERLLQQHRGCLSSACDIYAVGLIYSELVCGITVEPESRFKQELCARDVILSAIERPNGKCDAFDKEFITHCLELNPLCRPTAFELLNKLACRIGFNASSKGKI